MNRRDNSKELVLNRAHDRGYSGVGPFVIKNIQILRALAANGVVIAHLALVEHKYGQGIAVLPGSTHALIGGVDLFFVISGFIMVTVMGRAPWSRFLADRVTRIYPPYWFYTTLVLIVFLIAPALVNSSYPHPPSIVRSYLLLPDSVPPLLAVGWTLVHEMYFYLCFALIVFLIGRTKISLAPWLSAWATLVVVMNDVVNTYGLHSPVVDVVTHPLTLEFIAGACVGIIVHMGATALGLPALALGVLQLIAIYVVVPDPQALTDVRDWIHVILIGVPCALIVYGAASLEREATSKIKDVLVALGNASYSTYLAHVLVLSVLGRLFVATPWHTPVTSAAFVVIGLASANLWGWLSYRLLEKPLQRWSRAKMNAA
jgi:peptidoglycan/LPS O-acetylase OafA/YrhL